MMVDMSFEFKDAKNHSERIRQAYDEYNGMGWKCLPIESGSKSIRVKGWQERSFSKDDFKGTANIGIQLGSTSGGLIDIDLDNPIARQIAGWFLPPTTWRFGRIYEDEGDEEIASHWLYHVEGSLTSSGEWRLSKKETGGQVVKCMEYRGENAQTVFPPSKHKSNVVWVEKSGTPPLVKEKDLKQALGVIMTIIWVKANIAPGIFHDAMLRVVGGFAKAGVDIEVAKKAVQVICYLTDQEDVKDRLASVDQTYDKLMQDKTVAGFASLSAFGWETDRIHHWLPTKVSESGKVAKDGKPKINMSRIPMADAVEEAITILAAITDREKQLFSYAGAAVSVIKRDKNQYSDIQVAVPSQDAFAHHIERHIQFVKSDAKEHVDLITEADPRLVRRLMDPSINWGLPSLSGVVMHPLLLPSGKLLIEEGFCRESGIYVGDNLNLTMDEIKSTTVDEAKELILSMYSDFPFHDREVGESLSVTCFLTALARKALPICPAFIATSPYPQDGKTIWSCIPQMVLSKTSTTYSLSKNEEEQNKQLMSYFMGDPSVLVFDNQNGKFYSQALTELITSGSLKFRMLGSNTVSDIRSRSTLIINGINVTPYAEMATRAVVVQFNKRKDYDFKIPRILEHVSEVRRELIKAGLRLLLNGMDTSTVKFETQSRFFEWDEFVRKAVVVAGFIDPMREDLKSIVASDEDESRQELLDWLHSKFSRSAGMFKAKDVCDKVGFNTEIEDLFKAVAHKNVFSTMTVGVALSNLRGAEIDGSRFVWKKMGKNLNGGYFENV